ncbi:MAG: LysR substrate-binding domain-containing protein [Ancalomicrobiaceae bacterium]|nr:LysR substrate-binding domain-containing protein [Ancalomicrobiaceae bacterium]
MQNIPTELLRAFIAVIDLKGFTRAGAHLGRSQPAISLQIKRLQDLVGAPLFERENGGSVVTDTGRVVEAYARRILSLNDELVAKLAARDFGGTIRIGMAYEYAEYLLAKLLNRVGSRKRKLNFEVTRNYSARLLASLREGSLDLVCAIADGTDSDDLSLRWSEPLSWLGLPEIFAETSRPLPLVVYPDGCFFRNEMVRALTRIKRPYEIVYTGESLSSLTAAWRSGFGVTALPTRSIEDEDRRRFLGHSYGLPKLADMASGIYVTRSPLNPDAQMLAGAFADLLRQDDVPVA